MNGFDRVPMRWLYVILLLAQVVGFHPWSARASASDTPKKLSLAEVQRLEAEAARQLELGEMAKAAERLEQSANERVVVTSSAA